ncbi:MAG: phage holin [Clostridia bacterium]
MKAKLKSGSFWISLVSAVVLILKSIFGWELDNALIASLSDSALGVLVVFGIIKDHPAQTNGTTTSTQEPTENIDDKSVDKE